MSSKKRRIKLISWNVNGLRAVVKKEFFDQVERMDADILALQETKIQAPQLTDAMQHIDGYQSYWSHASVKKGYSGVGVYTRIEPQTVKTGMGIARFDEEGRILELDLGDFIFFNIYFPNGQMSEERLQYKLDFYEKFFEYADGYKHDNAFALSHGFLFFYLLLHCCSNITEVADEAQRG